MELRERFTLEQYRARNPASNSIAADAQAVRYLQLPLDTIQPRNLPLAQIASSGSSVCMLVPQQPLVAPPPPPPTTQQVAPPPPPPTTQQVAPPPPPPTMQQPPAQATLSTAASSSTAPAHDMLVQAITKSHVLATPASAARRQLTFETEAAAFQNSEYTPMARDFNYALNMEVVYVRIYLLLLSS